MDKPKHRSKLRLALGSSYYRLKRHLLWLRKYPKFAKQYADLKLEHTCFSHATPLIRKLKDVDMHLQYNKVENLKIAIKKINDVIIYPGETFSYWKLIGKPTKRKGYLPGMVLYHGTVREGTGGGLCQLSNLIYWMTLHTPLTILERHRHGYDVFPDSDRTQPFGSGATCHYNYIDLIIKNDTSQAFQLNLVITDENLEGSWLSDASLNHSCIIYESDHLFKHESWGKYSRHNILRKKIYDQYNNEIADEYITENHAIVLYSPMLETSYEKSSIN